MFDFVCLIGLQDSTRSIMPRWLQRPLGMFGVPFIAMLCAPKIYYKIAPYTSSLYPHNEDQLQDIASLMDGIYTTLANMTFIPPSAIKRGPHQINVTAIPCERTPAVIRLMEIMPYVDRIHVNPIGFD